MDTKEVIALLMLVITFLSYLDNHFEQKDRDKKDKK